MYPREYLLIQLAFAQKMARLAQESYEELLLDKTTIPRILGLGWSIDPNDSVWQAYRQGLQQEASDVDWTYQFYLTYLDNLPTQHTQHWGCFSYEYLVDEKTINLHFTSSLDASGYGPLSSLRRGARITELSSMFAHIQEKHPSVQLVHGWSWLYNRPEYTRLFPAEYVETARASEPHLRARGLGLWGQFLRHNGRINEQTSAFFLERLAQLSNAEHYAQCFPYQVMWVEAPIELFYGFYGIASQLTHHEC